MKKTKILCTLGPATNNVKIIEQMHKSGMNGVRINTAFGTHEEYRQTIKTARKAADIPILMDIKGPEIRLKCKDEIKVEKGGTIWIGFSPKDEVSFNRRIYDQLKINDTIVLNKGKTKARIKTKKGGRIKLGFTEECLLKNGQGVNIPLKKLDIPTLSSHDLKTIKLAKELNLDYIALSFTRNANDILKLKKSLKGAKIGIIAKIENQEGVDNASEILKSCDGVMIARGDLGIEVPPERVPLIQKDLINRCNRMGKISIVATEMLHSMVNNPEPTRAETSDVANAILDGADVVMLSGESAVGKYPEEAVKTMTRIANEVEPHLTPNPEVDYGSDKISLSIAKACLNIVCAAKIDKIVVATSTGYTARLISNFRLCKDIIAITNDPAVRKKLHLVWGVHPIVHQSFHRKERVLEIGKFCLREGLVRHKDTVLFAAAFYTNKPKTNMLMVQNISDLIRYDLNRKKNKTDKDKKRRK